MNDLNLFASCSKLEEMVYIFFFSTMQHNWKGSAIKRDATVQVCAKVNACTFFFFLVGMQEDLKKHFFCAPTERWGNENKMEWMQGLRVPCPACADESQRPDLIHTPGSMNRGSCIHAEKCLFMHNHTRKLLVLSNAMVRWSGAIGDTSFSGIICSRHLFDQFAKNEFLC